MIRAVFVSDQPLSALGLWTLLSLQDEYDLVGKFTSEERPRPFFPIPTI